MKKFKKPICVMLSAVMLFTLGACRNDASEVIAASSVQLKWTDTCLFEKLDEMGKQDLKDDYYAYVNYEWAKEQVPDFTADISFFAETEWAGYAKRGELCDDQSFTSPELELIRDCRDIYSDWDYRNAQGVEPLKKYLAYIDEIQTLDDVSAYMIDNEKNPLAATLIDMEVGYNDLNDDLSVILSKPYSAIEDDDNYGYIEKDGFRKKEQTEARVTYLLDRCGYSKKEIRRVLKGSFRLEHRMKGIGEVGYVANSEVITRAEMLDYAGNYPIGELLDHYDLNDIDSYTGQLQYLDDLEKLYTEKNVEDIKAFFKVRLILGSLIYLDEDTMKMMRSTGVDKTDKFAEPISRTTDFYFFYSIAHSSFSAAMDQAYIDAYYNEDTRNEIHDMIADIKSKYRELIDQNESLSEESKKSVFLKLDMMGEHIMVPDNTADYSGVSIKTKAEGGSYLDALCVINAREYKNIGLRINNKHGLDYWDIYDDEFSTVKRNAFYYRLQNSIYFTMGILEEPMYNADYPYEKKLAIVGTIIGHEISHGFDINGIRRDAYGKPNAAVTPEELKNWDKVSTRILTNFSTIQPFEGSARYDLESPVTGEVIADIEGVHVCLLIANDYENFDYDLFFRSFAEHWRSMDTKGGENKDIKSGSHPLTFIRVNYTLMQFDEFVETYDIKPGDGMYLAPEDRIRIW